MSFKQFIKELNGDKVEGELIKTILYSLLTSFILLGILYYFKFREIQNFIPKYGLFIFLSALSYAIIIPAMRQIRAYKQMPCMSGMMIGMTTGMIAGFLAGYIVGATNGMFVGGVFGMIIGILIGIWTGSCCGVMGFMEGMMAGFMGGWMGAMTSVMLLNDHLNAASIIIVVVLSAIMISLNYMIYKETKERKRESEEDFMLDIIITAILISITTWLMIYGPRSALFQ
ncbi:MAG: hypothetical protein Q8L29_02500 [archaeon]|nr:hypothetical protein [archaeon]